MSNSFGRSSASTAPGSRATSSRNCATSTRAAGPTRRRPAGRTSTSSRSSRSRSRARLRPGSPGATRHAGPGRRQRPRTSRSKALGSCSRSFAQAPRGPAGPRATRIASAGSGDPPTRQRSSIRSVTSRPLFLRASWTSRTTSRAARQPQLGRELQVERDGLAAAGADRPARSRRLGDHDLVAGQLDRLVLDLDRRAPGPQRGHELAGSAAAIAAGDRLRRAAEPLAQRAEVRLDRQLDQLAGVGEAGDLDDVQLLGDLRRAARLGSVVPAAAPRPAPGRAADGSSRPDSARAARPSSTSRRTSAICSPSSVVDQRRVGRRPRGQVHRLGGVRRSPGATASCQTCSVMNGHERRQQPRERSRHSCRVASAAGSPSQNRRRDRRTYQLDRSSM